MHVRRALDRDPVEFANPKRGDVHCQVSQMVVARNAECSSSTAFGRAAFRLEDWCTHVVGAAARTRLRVCFRGLQIGARTRTKRADRIVPHVRHKAALRERPDWRHFVRAERPRGVNHGTNLFLRATTRVSAVCVIAWLVAGSSAHSVDHCQTTCRLGVLL